MTLQQINFGDVFVRNIYLGLRQKERVLPHGGLITRMLRMLDVDFRKETTETVKLGYRMHNVLSFRSRRVRETERDSYEGNMDPDDLDDIQPINPMRRVKNSDIIKVTQEMYDAFVKERTQQRKHRVTMEKWKARVDSILTDVCRSLNLPSKDAEMEGPADAGNAGKDDEVNEEHLSGNDSIENEDEGGDDPDISFPEREKSQSKGNDQTTENSKEATGDELEPEPHAGVEETQGQSEHVGVHDRGGENALENVVGNDSDNDDNGSSEEDGDSEEQERSKEDVQAQKTESDNSSSEGTEDAHSQTNENPVETETESDNDNDGVNIGNADGGVQKAPILNDDSSDPDYLDEMEGDNSSDSVDEVDLEEKSENYPLSAHEYEPEDSHRGEPGVQNMKEMAGC